MGNNYGFYRRQIYVFPSKNLIEKFLDKEIIKIVFKNP